MPNPTTLEERHAELDKTIAKRQRHPLRHDLEVTTLKKRKLALKDRLEKS